MTDRMHPPTRSTATDTADVLVVGAGIAGLAAAVDDVLPRLGLNESDAHLARWHLNLLVREDCGTEPEALSARGWDEGFEVYGYGDSIVLPGFQTLTDHMATGLDIRLETTVRRIEHGDDGVAVTTDRGFFRAARAVVTLPLGVLKSGAVAFEPALPADKQAAVERLGFGALAKVGLRFKEVFWPPQVYVFGLEEGSGDDATFIVNKAAVDGSPLLTLLAGGALGRRIESLPDEDAVAWAMAKIRRAFCASAPDPVAVFRTSWSRDPFAYGAYSFVAAGSSAADLAALATPVDDRLFFAGEATNASQWAVAHGASISGLREAARITGDVSLLPPRNFTENRR